ncbi:MAG TPA: ComEC/Rec2 family competence protein, partial [Candidatus Binataceae bacterium]|nr:ComEC/Rec2 family competence protein [Candidatus Binataceae bacterium]
MALAVLLGEGLGNFRIFAPGWLAVALLSVAGLAFVARYAALGLGAALLAIVAGSTCSVQLMLAPPNVSIRQFPDGSPLTIEGCVIREPERVLERTRLYVAVERAAPPAQPLVRASGMVRVTTEQGGFWVGDVIRLNAKIRFPRNDGNPGEFDYEAYLAREGVAATMTVPGPAFGSATFQRIGHRPI